MVGLNIQKQKYLPLSLSSSRSSTEWAFQPSLVARNISKSEIHDTVGSNIRSSKEMQKYGYFYLSDVLGKGGEKLY